MLTLSRPAKIDSDEIRLDAEYRSARWIHHRLLDFEDLHQRLLDAAAEASAPRITRVGRILARLSRRAKRRERTTAGSWSPNPHPELAEHLKVLLGELREKRNTDPRWVAACRWADQKAGVAEPLLEELLTALHEKIAEDPRLVTAIALDWAGKQAGEPKQVRRRRAKDPRHVKRRKNETDEAWAKRFALFTADETDEHFKKKQEEAGHTRREMYRNRLYKHRRCYWGTWNALLRSVDQARKDVLARRKQGMPAEWRRPKFRDPSSLAADAGGFRIVDRGESGTRWVRDASGNEILAQGSTWWTVEVRIGVGGSRGHEHEPEEWISLRAKCGNWHEMPEDVKFTTAKLTRRKDGARWAYSLSLTVEGVAKPATKWATSGRVAYDWGHREHGHDTASEGLRAFVWHGDDGRTGEVLIPLECRRMQDEVDALKKRLDETFNARKAARELTDRNRYDYRRRLERSGVRTEEDANWLRWEVRYERRIAKRRKRFQNLRRETYTRAVRELRERYTEFVFESERIHDAKKPRSKRGQTIRELQTEDAMVRRKRANRDLCARYEFVSLCERFGADLITVPARNTTRECPAILPNGEKCRHIGENGPELLVACPACGTVRDKDHGAATVILRRAQEALANHAAE